MQEGKRRFNEGNEEEVRREGKEGRRDRAKELMNYRNEERTEE